MQVYLNLRSVLRAAGVNLEDTNAEYKEDTARIEADKVGVPEADRIASTLSYPYRLSGASPTVDEAWPTRGRCDARVSPLRRH